MRPTDLDDLAPVEPSDELLARVQVRGVAVRRRRRAQRLTSVVGGVLVIAFAVGIAMVRVDGGDDRVSAPDPSATTTTTQAKVTSDELAGDWLPVAIGGYDGPLSSPPLALPLLRFDRRGNWRASDGCNTQGGSYRTTGGTFSIADLYTTGLGCDLDPVPTASALARASRFEVVAGQLTFFANDGAELARYVRAVVTTRIDLPSRTIVAGSTMSGRVIVENNTGKALKATGCGSLFQVALENAEVHPDILWLSCGGDIIIPTGSSSYPVTVESNYSDARPLPAGDYSARLFQSTHVVPAPNPIPIRVAAP